MRVSIIIPARNEEEGIGATLQMIPRKEIEAMGYELEVVVVDNDCEDKTPDIAKSMDCRVICEKAHGYGMAYRAGFKNATGDIIITADTDGTYPLTDIPRLLKIMDEDNLEFLNTDRLSHLVSGNMPAHNKVGNLILNFMMLVLYGMKMKDTQSGMWVFRRYVLDKISLDCPDVVFAQELKLEVCYFEKYRWGVTEIPYYQRIGESKLMGGWKSWKNGFMDVYYLVKKRISR